MLEPVALKFSNFSEVLKSNAVSFTKPILQKLASFNKGKLGNVIPFNFLLYHGIFDLVVAEPFL